MKKMSMMLTLLLLAGCVKQVGQLPRQLRSQPGARWQKPGVIRRSSRPMWNN
ncbi:Uncharacterised protein [Serratia fonticola]|uniref:Lipoprotein n=1 Tax=Serratia fonticola TaxID=47917 RepID=A0A4U9TP84_SERFO|nr:Uncharacterised protein [Serratia fonticola]